MCRSWHTFARGAPLLKRNVSVFSTCSRGALTTTQSTRDSTSIPRPIITTLRVHSGRRRSIRDFRRNDHKTGQATDTDLRFTKLEARVLTSSDGRASNAMVGQVIQSRRTTSSIDRRPSVCRDGLSERTDARDARRKDDHDASSLANPWRISLIRIASRVDRGIVDARRRKRRLIPSIWLSIACRVGSRWCRECAEEKGKVLSIGGKRVACHRRDRRIAREGQRGLHPPGCLVRDDAESTWDCPCHGSRFTPTASSVDAERRSARVGDESSGHGARVHRRVVARQPRYALRIVGRLVAERAIPSRR